MHASLLAYGPSSRRLPFLLWQLVVVGAVLAADWNGPGWGPMWGAGVALIVGWFEPRRWHVPLGLRKRVDWRRVVLFGLVVGVVQLLLVKVVLTPAIEHLIGQRRDLSMFDYLRGNWHALFAMLPIVWISAGFCEERAQRLLPVVRHRPAPGLRHAGHRMHHPGIRPHTGGLGCAPVRLTGATRGVRPAPCPGLIWPSSPSASRPPHSARRPPGPAPSTPARRSRHPRGCRSRGGCCRPGWR